MHHLIIIVARSVACWGHTNSSNVSARRCVRNVTVAAKITGTAGASVRGRARLGDLVEGAPHVRVRRNMPHIRERERKKACLGECKTHARAQKMNGETGGGGAGGGTHQMSLERKSKDT